MQGSEQEDKVSKFFTQDPKPQPAKPRTSKMKRFNKRMEPYRAPSRRNNRLKLKHIKNKIVDRDHSEDGE